VVAALVYLNPEASLELERTLGSDLRAAISAKDSAKLTSALDAARKSLETARKAIDDEYKILSESDE
jgi:hypothetical protein